MFVLSIKFITEKLQVQWNFFVCVANVPLFSRQQFSSVARGKPNYKRPKPTIILIFCSFLQVSNNFMPLFAMTKLCNYLL